MKELSIESNKQVNYNSIDCLKFVMALCVIGIHTAGPFDGTILGLALQLILFTLAVPLFFATSGFFFYKKLRVHMSVETLADYCKRLSKIYIIWTILYIPHMIIDYQNQQGWGMLRNGTVVLIRNLIFLGSYNQLWYLIGSIWGGGVLYLAIKYFKNEKKVIACSIAVCIIAMLFDSCAGLWPMYLRYIPTLYRGYFISVRNGLLFGFPFLGIGVAVHHLQYIKPRKALLFSGMFFVYRMAATFIIKQYDMEFSMMIIPGTWGCVLFSLIWLLKVDLVIADKLSQWLRKSSILIFLIHPYMIDVARLMTDNSTGLYLLVSLLSVIFSGTVILLEQRKGFRWLRQLY